MKKFCFLSEANYPNYVKRLKNYNLKRYLELNLNIPFYISTNMPSEFHEYKDNDLIRVFDINTLREKNKHSLANETLPTNPTGLYPSKYPWNLRRFILRRAAEDGYNGLFFLECDTKISENIGKDSLIEYMNNVFEEQTVKTSASRFVYSDRYDGQELFGYHDAYIDELNLDFNDEQYDTLDGTNQMFFGKNPNSIIKFVDVWDDITKYGYDCEHGYKNGYLSNLSIVMPISGYTLKNEESPFITEHHFEDRY